MFLPHELVCFLLQKNSAQSLLVQGGMSTDTKAHVDMCSAKLSKPVLGLGLWTDGVPCNWDRSQSLECFSLFFPGWTGDFSKLRIPLLVIQKRFVVQQSTFDDVCAALKYSFDALATGVFPSQRHTADPWLPTDSKWKSFAGRPIGIRGAISEIRGDAKWRQERISHVDFLVRLHQLGLHPNPLFDAPFFSVSIFKIDWLHCMDLGCAADWIGNLFSYLLHKFPGQNLQDKCSSLFLRLQTLYSQNEVPGKYDNLTVKMFRQEKKGFKMRGKASEVRGLVGFAKELSEDNNLLSSTSPVELTIKQGTKLLAQCYQCLSSGADTQALAASCRQCCILWTALDTNHPHKA